MIWWFLPETDEVSHCSPARTVWSLTKVNTRLCIYTKSRVCNFEINWNRSSAPWLQLTGQQTKDSVSAVTFTSHINTIYSQQWSHTEYLGIKLKPNFAVTDFQDCTCSVQQSKWRDLWWDDCPSTHLKSTLKVMVSLRTTSLHVLPRKGFAKNKGYRKSLQSIN